MVRSFEESTESDRQRVCLAVPSPSSSTSTHNDFVRVDEQFCRTVPPLAFVQSSTLDGDPVAWLRRCIPFHVNDKGSEDIGLQIVLETIQNLLGHGATLVAPMLNSSIEGNR